MKTVLAGIAVIGLTALLVATAQADPTSDEDLIEGYRTVPEISIRALHSRADRFPIAIPTAAELRKMLKAREPLPKPEVKKEKDSVFPRDIPLGDLSQIPPVGRRRCDRAIPTRSEFLRMLKYRPADARQIMEQCNIDVSSISPIRQLPVGARQLPQDTRQRPVGTWGR